MQYLKLIISNNAPNTRSVIWAKPIEGGYALYIFGNGMWKPLKAVDDKGTSSISDDTIISTSGSLSAKIYELEDSTYGIKLSSSEEDIFEPLEESTI